MSQDNLHDIRNLFVYTKTNVDELLARFTSTADLVQNYYQKNAIDRKIL